MGRYTHGICPKVVELLHDHQFKPDETRHLHKMKAARQIEAVEMMIASNSITAAHVDALLKATPPEQRMDYTPPKPQEPMGDPLEQKGQANGVDEIGAGAATGPGHMA